MIVLRLFLIFLAGLVLRRAIIYLFSSRTKVRRPSSRSASHSGGRTDDDVALDKLTQQDVSDADFEEIP